MKFIFLNLICTLILYHFSMGQSKFPDYECAKSFALKDSCVYLRDFALDLNEKAHQKWNLKLASNTKYLFLLCRGKFEKNVSEAIMKLYDAKGKLIKETKIGSYFIFKCDSSGDYLVEINTPKPVKNASVVGILYFMSKF